MFCNTWSLDEKKMFYRVPASYEPLNCITFPLYRKSNDVLVPNLKHTITKGLLSVYQYVTGNILFHIDSECLILWYISIFHDLDILEAFHDFSRSGNQSFKFCVFSRFSKPAWTPAWFYQWSAISRGTIPGLEKIVFSAVRKFYFSQFFMCIFMFKMVQVFSKFTSKYQHFLGKASKFYSFSSPRTIQCHVLCTEH